MNKLTLDKLSLNESAYIIKNNINTENKRHLLNLGITKGSKITAIYKSPFNDPTAYLVKETIIAIRKEDAKKIIIRKEKQNGSNQK